MIKKDLVVAILATFCLTATLFMVLPTRSQYDPWIDANDDGVIDSTDLGMLGNGWGTFGDPAKEVIIANHTTMSKTINVTIPTYGFASILISTNGSEEIDIGFNSYSSDNIGCTVLWFVGDPQPLGSYYQWDTFTITAWAYLFKVYDVHGSKIELYFSNGLANPVYLYVDYYMST